MITWRYICQSWEYNAICFPIPYSKLTSDVGICSLPPELTRSYGNLLIESDCN